ncbi:MAG: hypothetical protein ABR603_10955 [Pyrinomonadaceae bacterium]
MLRVRLAVVFKSALGAAVLSAAALSSDAFAQAAAPRPTPSQQPRPSTARPAPPPAAGGEAGSDLSITARVTADSLRFEKVPNTRVEFTGQPERVTVWEAERENLPPQVRPGVTYRNVGITLRITSVFADIDRIVAEALGEVPVGGVEGTRPAPAQPPPAPPAAAPRVASSPSKSSPANSVTNVSRRRPAQRGRGN